MRTAQHTGVSHGRRSTRSFARAFMLITLAVAITAAMMPRSHANVRAAQSQSLIQAHHHRTKRRNRHLLIGSSSGVSLGFTTELPVRTFREVALNGRSLSDSLAVRAPPA